MKLSYKIALPLLFLTRLAIAEYSNADSTLKSHLKADSASQITFEPGRSNLTSAEISSLSEMVSQAQVNGDKIDSIKVYVWPDKIYSETAGSASTKMEKKIADQRVKSIKSYLKRDLKVSDVETYNVARQPRAFTDLVKSNSGNIAGNEPESVTEFIKGSPSEALVLIYKK